MKKKHGLLGKEGWKSTSVYVAKGYAADKVKYFLLKRGLYLGIIDIGRNITFVGDRLGSDFRVGIQAPYIG